MKLWSYCFRHSILISMRDWENHDNDTCFTYLFWETVYHLLFLLMSDCVNSSVAGLMLDHVGYPVYIKVNEETDIVFLNVHVLRFCGYRSRRCSTHGASWTSVVYHWLYFSLYAIHPTRVEEVLSLPVRRVSPFLEISSTFPQSFSGKHSRNGVTNGVKFIYART